MLGGADSREEVAHLKEEVTALLQLGWLDLNK